MPNAESKEEREKRLERERRHQARVAANGGEPPLDVPEISWALRPPLSGLAGQPVGSLVSVMVVLRKDSKKEKNTYPMLEKLRVKVVGVYDGDTQVFEVELQGGGKTDNVIHVHRLDKHGRPTDREDKTKKAVVFFTFDGLVLPPLPLRNFAFRAKCKLNNDSVAWDHAQYIDSEFMEFLDPGSTVPPIVRSKAERKALIIILSGTDNVTNARPLDRIA